MSNSTAMQLVICRLSRWISPTVCVPSRQRTLSGRVTRAVMAAAVGVPSSGNDCSRMGGSLPGLFSALPDYAPRDSQAYSGFGRLAGRACHLSAPRCDTWPVPSLRSLSSRLPYVWLLRVTYKPLAVCRYEIKKVVAGGIMCDHY